MLLLKGNRKEMFSIKLFSLHSKTCSSSKIEFLHVGPLMRFQFKKSIISMDNMSDNRISYLTLVVLEKRIFATSTASTSTSTASTRLTVAVSMQSMLYSM